VTIFVIFTNRPELKENISGTKFVSTVQSILSDRLSASQKVIESIMMLAQFFSSVELTRQELVRANIPNICKDLFNDPSASKKIQALAKILMKALTGEKLQAGATTSQAGGESLMSAASGDESSMTPVKKKKKRQKSVAGGGAESSEMNSDTELSKQTSIVEEKAVNVNAS
jgi:hypothetical protein